MTRPPLPEHSAIGRLLIPDAAPLGLVPVARMTGRRDTGTAPRSAGWIAASMAFFRLFALAQAGGVGPLATRGCRGERAAALPTASATR